MDVNWPCVPDIIVPNPAVFVYKLYQTMMVLPCNQSSITVVRVRAPSDSCQHSYGTEEGPPQ